MIAIDGVTWLSRMGGVRAAALALSVGVLVPPGDAPPERAPAPSLAWDDTGFAVAWARVGGSGLGGTLYVQRAGAAPVAVLRDDLLRADVRLGEVNGGLLALALGRDPEGSNHGELSIVPIGGDGEGSAPSKWGIVDELCAGTAAAPGRVFVGATTHWCERRRHGDDDYLLGFNRDGGLEHYWYVTGSAIRCAIAARGDEVALAYTERVLRAGQMRANALVRVLSLQKPNVDFRVPIEDLDVRTIRIVATPDGWAVMARDGHRRLHVMTFDPNGTVLAGRELPASLDPESADLGVTDRGLFVSWIASGTVYLVGVDDSTIRALAPAGERPSLTAALGHGTSCAVAWTEADGAQAHLVASAECP